MFRFQMKKLYSWHDVAKRTEIVYDRALRCSNQDLLERLSRYAHYFFLFLYPLSSNYGKKKLLGAFGYLWDKIKSTVMYLLRLQK